MEDLRNDEIEVKGFEFEEQEETMETKKTVFDRIKDAGSSAIDKVKEGIDYAKEHPDEAAEKLVGGATVLGIGALALMGIHTAKEVERTVYSEEIGETVKLKRKLTNRDKVELDYREKTGQTKIEALDDMNLIK